MSSTPLQPQNLGAVVPGAARLEGEPTVLRDAAPTHANSPSSPLVTPDVKRLMERLNFSSQDLLNIDRNDLTKICDLFEPDPLEKISLKVHFLSLVQSLKAVKQQETTNVPASRTIVNSIPTDQTVRLPPVEQPVIGSPPVERPPSVDSEQSLFGSVAFPSRLEKSRDTNRWTPVLGRLYKGSSDSVPISSLCQKLISVGVRESLSNVEFYRFVLANFDIDINTEIINFLEKQNCVEDTLLPPV